MADNDHGVAVMYLTALAYYILLKLVLQPFVSLYNSALKCFEEADGSRIFRVNVCQIIHFAIKMTFYDLILCAGVF